MQLSVDLQKTFVLDDNVNLNGYSVVFPSVCVGNAAQLAVDLLISTLEMRKVATVWHVSTVQLNYLVVDFFELTNSKMIISTVSHNSSIGTACF